MLFLILCDEVMSNIAKWRYVLISDSLLFINSVTTVYVRKIEL